MSQKQPQMPEISVDRFSFYKIFKQRIKPSGRVYSRKKSKI